jgi:hypothetical protein
MSEPTEKVVIRNRAGDVVGRFAVREGALHGRGTWFDGNGVLVADGVFEAGRPHDGTFLNWSRFFSDADSSAPYDAHSHLRDWVSRFEECFRSERPKYDMVREKYADGEQSEAEPVRP